MPKFRKRPVVIEAMQFVTGEDGNGMEIEAWSGTKAIAIGNRDNPTGEWRPICLSIDTLEGKMSAVPGDWIICGVKGEYYPCKPDIFAATYEPVP